MPDLAVGTSFDFPYDTNILVDGSGGLCPACCKTPIAITAPDLIFNRINHAGLDSSGNVVYRTFTAPIDTHQVILKEAIIYYAQSNGVARHTRGSYFIDKLSSLHCNGIDVDASGNIYIAHNRSGSVSVTKINSSGVSQWTYDTGANALKIRLNYNETKLLIVGFIAVDGDFVWVLDTDGNEIATVAGVANPYSIACAWDIADNIYHSRDDWIINKRDFNGNLLWLGSGVGGVVRSIATDNTYVYLTTYPGDGSNENVNFVTAITIAEDPGDPGRSAQVWRRNSRGGVWATVSAAGNLYTASPNGHVWELDVSNGDIIWAATEILPFGTFGWSPIISIDVMGRSGVMPWACANNYGIGELVTHNEIIYESILIHLSCDDPAGPDEPGVGIDWETYWVQI